MKTNSILKRSILDSTISILLGISFVIASYPFNLSKMLTAQIALGIFGFSCGFAHGLLIKTAYGKISLKTIAFVSIIWSLSVIAGGTPLFMTLGTPAEMAFRMFYSFSICGAIGAYLAAIILKNSYKEGSINDPLPSVITRSLSFAFSIVICELAGRGLSKFLPDSVSWLLALSVMVIINGAGSGYSIIYLFEKNKKSNQSNKIPLIDTLSVSYNKKWYLLVFILLILPFYLNDLSNIYIKDWRLWLCIDYLSVKVFPIIVLFWLIKNQKIKYVNLGIASSSIISFVTTFFICTIFSLFIEHNEYLLLGKLPGYSAIGTIPIIENSIWHYFDLTIGLLMVGIVEEIVFRGYFYLFLSLFTKRSFIIIIVSAIAFGLIHWSFGLNSIIITSIIGAFLMIAYMKTGSLIPIMLAHFAIDFIDFSDFIPKSIFFFQVVKDAY